MPICCWWRAAAAITLTLLLGPRARAETAPDVSRYHFPPPGESLQQQNLRAPDEVGLEPRIVDALAGTAARWALWRHGYLVHVAGDFNDRIIVASLRKTWHALAVGAALGAKRIPSLDQKISVWVPELAGHDRDATWRHVLTQSSAFDYPYGGQPDYKPGEIWTYSDANPYHLTNALAKVYGRAGFRDDYGEVLRQAYFDAIGMRGYYVGPRYDGAVLGLDLEDMGRLGLLVLARGNWAGRQIIPRDFVEQLETKQTRGMKLNPEGPNDGSPAVVRGLAEAPYGFMTWVNSDRDVYPRADSAWAWGHGAGGNAIFWNHKNGVVLAVQRHDETTRFPEIIDAHVAGPNPILADREPIAVVSADRILRDPLTSPAPTHGEASKRAVGGEFTRRGWRATKPGEMLVIELERLNGHDGTLEIDITGIDWQTVNRAAKGKVHFLNMFSSPSGDHHCTSGHPGTPRDALWTLRAGRDETTDAPRYGNSFKVLWASRAAKGCEGSDYHEQVVKLPPGWTWDKDRTYKFRVSWSRARGYWNVDIDGQPLFEGPWKQSISPLRHVFIGKAADFGSFVGPVYSNLRVYRDVHRPAPAATAPAGKARLGLAR